MNFDIAKAWKDAQYRETLTSEELAQLPQNPIGAIELTDAALSAVSGACGSSSQLHQNYSYGYQFNSGYQFDGYFQPHQCHHHHHHHCHGGNNWFGGFQQPNGGGNWFGGNQSDKH